MPEFLIPFYNVMTTSFYTALRQSQAEGIEFTAGAFLGITTLYTFPFRCNFIETQNFMFSGPTLDWFSAHYKGGVWKKLFEKTAAPPPPKEPQIIDSSDEEDLAAEDKSCDKSRLGGSRKQISTTLKVSQLSTLV